MTSSSSRQFIDLILKASDKWANFDPAIAIEVGAYGVINRKDGTLQVEGNIYSDDFKKILADENVSLDLTNFRPQEGPSEKIEICSSNAKQLDISAGPELDFFFANAVVKGEWQFQQGSRGAVLMMHDVRQRFIPPNGILEKLSKLAHLKGKCLVTSVFSCSAYTMCLSDKSGNKVSLALTGTVPIALAAGMAAGGNVALGWQVKGNSTYIRSGVAVEPEKRFIPLYSLRRSVSWLSGRLMRDSPVEDPEGDEWWSPLEAPWEPLDEEGQEISYESDDSGVDDFE
ncbi:hypothetical protein F5I97DRAFT_1842266 [Phlebopus sp. FC_14]|nr:hypothetical protein F5I97DRAFT_1842266 [Phlebopus sp. FC_14]